MGARGWLIGMVVSVVVGVAASCVGALADDVSVMMWIAPSPYVIGFCCVVRLSDYLVAAPDKPKPFSLLGWLHD